MPNLLRIKIMMPNHNRYTKNNE